MKLKPKISIITPSYNQGKFIEQTILSVLNQDYDNIEYIIIDGGSTDNTLDIIKKYENKISYWISEKDKGQSHAINKGFKLATGDYIGWINSDDFYTAGAISKLVEYINKEPTSVLYYGIQGVCDDKGNHLYLEKFDEKMTFNKLLYGYSQVLQPGSFYKKEALEKVGYLNEELNFVMDWDLWLKLLQIGNSTFIPYVMAYIRRHTDAKSCNKKLSDILESKMIFEKYGGKYMSKKYLRYLFVIYLNYLIKKYK